MQSIVDIVHVDTNEPITDHELATKLMETVRFVMKKLKYEILSDWMFDKIEDDVLNHPVPHQIVNSHVLVIKHGDQHEAKCKLRLTSRSTRKKSDVVACAERVPGAVGPLSIDIYGVKISPPDGNASDEASYEKAIDSLGMRIDKMIR